MLATDRFPFLEKYLLELVVKVMCSFMESNDACYLHVRASKIGGTLLDIFRAHADGLPIPQILAQEEVNHGCALTPNLSTLASAQSSSI